MKPVFYSVISILDTDGIAQSQSPAGAGDLTLNGTYAGTTWSPQPVTITSVNNIAALIFTIYGSTRSPTTNEIVVADTDTVTGVNNNTVATTKLFTSVTRIAVDGVVAPNTCEAGLNGLVSMLYPVDIYAQGYRISAFVDSGSGTFTNSHCPINVIKEGWAAAQWAAETAFTDQTTDTDLFYEGGVGAFRLAMSVAGAGLNELTWSIVPKQQSELRSR